MSLLWRQNGSATRCRRSVTGAYYGSRMVGELEALDPSTEHRSGDGYAEDRQSKLPRGAEAILRIAPSPASTPSRRTPGPLSAGCHPYRNLTEGATRRIKPAYHLECRHRRPARAMKEHRNANAEGGGLISAP